MLYQADFYTEDCNISGVMSEIAVKIHGAAMSYIPTEYAEELHKKTYHPFSIFALPNGNGFVIRVSALSEDACRIINALKAKKQYKIYGMNDTLKIKKYDISEPITAYNAGELISGNKCRVNFVTPVMYKKNGKACNDPNIPAYFYSVVQKNNMFEHDNILFSEFTAAFDKSQIGEYSFQSVDYNVSGHIYPGMVGYCDIKFPIASSQATLLKKIFAYSTYCGAGGKTGMGMGGIVIT